MPHHVHAVTPAPPNPRLLFINSVGQTVITTLTIIGSSYLLYALMRQGRGKLRVRLLLGMILGDLLLGYVTSSHTFVLCSLTDFIRVGAFVPNAYVLAGGRFVTGTMGCVSLTCTRCYTGLD
jgi:hypothetical protein